MSDKVKCFISGPAGLPEEYRVVQDLLTQMNYDATTIYECFEGIDTSALLDIELRAKRNRAILDSGWLVLLQGWQENDEARDDVEFAKTHGIGISYASEMDALKLKRTG